VDPATVTTPISGGTPAEQVMVRQLLANLGPTALTAVTLTTRPEGLWLDLDLAPGTALDGPAGLRPRFDGGMLLLSLARAAGTGQAPRAPLGMTLHSGAQSFDMPVSWFYANGRTPADLIEGVGTQPSPDDIVRHVSAN